MRNKKLIIAIMLSVLYSHHCVLLRFEQLSDDGVGTVILGIDKNFKEITVKGKIKLRGPHLVSKFKESLSPNVYVTYKYIDDFPLPEDYVADLGDKGLDLKTQTLLYQQIINQKRSDNYGNKSGN